MKKSKFVILAIVGILATACSSTPPQQQINPSAKAAVAALPKSTDTEKAVVKSLAELSETNGNVKLTFDDNGNWISIVTIGSADVVGGDFTSALKVAKMRANAALAEFVNTSVRSSNSIDAIAKSQTNTGNPDDAADVKHENAAKVAEKIHMNATTIVKGAVGTAQMVEGDRASFVLSVTPNQIAAAKSIRQQMSGAFQ